MVCYRRLAYKRRAKKREEFIPLGVLLRHWPFGRAADVVFFAGAFAYELHRVSGRDQLALSALAAVETGFVLGAPRAVGQLGINHFVAIGSECLLHF